MSNDEGLFRPQALASLVDRSLGVCTIVQPLSIGLCVVLLVGLIAVASWYLFTHDYARKTTVSGYLEPTNGAVGVFPYAQGGVVDILHVSEGSHVRAGEPLATLRYPAQLGDSPTTAVKASHELREQLTTLEAELARLSDQQHSERQHLHQQLEDSRQELVSLRDALRLQRDRLAVSVAQANAIQQLASLAVVSRLDGLRSEADRIEQRKAVLDAEHRLLNRSQEQRDLRHQLRQLSDRYANEESRLVLQQSQVRQRLSELQQREGAIIRSPVAGTVTALQLKVGQFAKLSNPILLVTPDNTELAATLLLPSRALGFVKPGMTVRLSLDAYPHQQFGTVAATLTQLANAPVPGEQATSLVSVEGPVYFAHAQLSAQAISAFGSNQSLQAGMLLQADIILEARSLVDWLLEPLYSLRGRTG